MEKILEEIKAERVYQKELWSTSFDDDNTEGDWISYIANYASSGNPKLGVRPSRSFRAAMIKTASLAIAAIEAYDRKNS